MSTPQPTPDDATDLAMNVAENGIAAAEPDVARVVSKARRMGIGIALSAILADPTQPTVARERALGRLLVSLDRPLIEPTTREGAA